MDMTTAKYRFARPLKSVLGFSRSERPSTAALGAVETWSIAAPWRSVKVVEDEDEFLGVELSFRVSDANAAMDLDRLCVERGVERYAV